VSSVEFDIFEPLTEKDVRGGTVNRAKATCVCCGTVLHPDRVRAQLREQRGGADVMFDATGHRTGGARLSAVVAFHSGEQARHYRAPTAHDYEAVWKAQKKLDDMVNKLLSGGLSPEPDESLPLQGTLGFRVQQYGMLQWGDLFTARQKLAMITLNRLLNDLEKKEYGVADSAGLGASRLTDIGNFVRDEGERYDPAAARLALSLATDLFSRCL